MDFVHGLSIPEGILLVDRAGSLRLFDGEDYELLYRSKDPMRIWMPCIRRSLTVFRGKVYYSDGEDSFIVEYPDLLPTERPPGYILDGPLTCKGKVLYVLKEKREFRERITACTMGTEGPVVGLYRNSRSRVLAHKRYSLGRDLVSVIKVHAGVRVGTLKGRLFELTSGFMLDIGREIRDIAFLEEAMLVLTRTDGRSLIYVIEEGEIREKHVLPGRYNGFVEHRGELYVVGERVSNLNF